MANNVSTIDSILSVCSQNASTTYSPSFFSVNTFKESFVFKSMSTESLDSPTDLQAVQQAVMDRRSRWMQYDSRKASEPMDEMGK